MLESEVSMRIVHAVIVSACCYLAVRFVIIPIIIYVLNGGV